MTKRIKQAFAILLSAAMLCAIPIAGAQAETAYTAQQEYGAGLYLISSPHKIAQEFVPDFTDLKTVKAYLQLDGDNVVTLSIQTSVDDEPLYSEDFSFENAYTGWATFELSSAVSLTQGQRYVLVLTSTKRAVWFGKQNVAADTSAPCVINFDETAYGGWMRELHGVAFELLPVPSSWQQVMWAIDALPEIITLNDAALVAAVRRDYNALSQEDRQKVTNDGLLIAAEEQLSALKQHTFAGQSDASAALFQIKRPSAAGQEFIPDFTNLTKISVYLDISADCDITLNITQGITTDQPQTLYTEIFPVVKQTGWVDFLLRTPVYLTEGSKFEFTLSSTEGVGTVVFGKNGASQDDAAGCCALNGDGAWVRYTNNQTAFRVEGTAIEDYQSLMRRIGALPETITLDDEAAVAALLEEYDSLPAETQQKVVNYEVLTAAQAAIEALKLQQKIDTLIADIGSLNPVEQLTLNDASAVSDLRSRYDALPSEAQQTITNYTVLTAAEEKIAELKAADQAYEALIQKIAALPELISIQEKPVVESLAEQYRALSEQDQQKVSNYAKLADAEAYIADMMENPMSPDDVPFTYQLDSSTALYLLTGPDHMAGQEFIPDFSELTAVAAYLDLDGGNTITLTIGQDATGEAVSLYTEDFYFEDSFTGWYRFDLATPLEVTPDEKYDFTLVSTERAVLFGQTGTATDPMGCLALNYDPNAYSGWVKAMHSTGFQVIGKQIEAYRLLINRIASLPSQITLQQETTVAKLRKDYDALPAEDQNKVTNYDILVAAEKRLAEIRGEDQKADTQKATQLIDAIGSTISLDSFDAIFAADQAVSALIEKYGKEALEAISNYDALLHARAQYNTLIRSLTMGDINDDGSVDAADALLALQHSVKLVALTGKAAYAAMVNTDDTIDAADALLILQHSVKLIDAFPAQPEEINLQTSKNSSLFEATYQSLLERTAENGYANTSITGAYPGMFVRDTSIQVLSHIACGDFDQARKILNYTLLYHQMHDYDYALHIMNNNTPPISDKIQADTTFFLLHAWCQFAANAPQTEENLDFIELYTDKIQAMANYFFDNGYYNEELGLIRNPSLEHSRDGAYFNAYDLLTNVYASQALHELSLFFQNSAAQDAAKWGAYADQIAQGIHKNLVAEVDGKTIYAEMKSIDKELAATGQRVQDDQFYIGFSWVNMAPAGAGWYALNQEIMNNTYEKYLQYGSTTYYKKYQMLEVVAVFHSPEDYRVSGNHVIGKGLAWELMLCYDTGRYERVRELISFIEENSDEMYRETWGYGGGGSDTANQEHASWMIIANEYTCHF